MHKYPCKKYPYLREKLNFLLQYNAQDHSKAKIVVPEELNYGT